MKPRMSRHNHQRRCLESVVNELNAKLAAKMPKAEQTITLSLTSITDDELSRSNVNYQICQVDVSIAKIGFNKRKDIAPLTETGGSGQIAVNPRKNTDLDMKPFILHLNFNNLKNQGGKVYLIISARLPKESCENGAISESETFKRKKKPDFGFNYVAELIVSTDGQHIALTEGDYEITLKRRFSNSQQSMNSLKNNNKIDWRLFENNENIDFPPRENPVLNMRVDWNNDEDFEVQIKKPKLVANVKKEKDQIMKVEDHVQNNVSAKPAVPASTSVRIQYRFMHNNVLQWTTNHADYNCPWCNLKCHQLKSLGMHLRFCHGRFNFSFQFEAKNSPRTEGVIEVTPNENYDGSYSGNPFDQSQSKTCGYAFSRNGPARRTPVTVVLVRGGRRSKRHEGFDLEDDDMECIQNPLVMGHDRLYYHTNTCLPIRPQDMDIDSEEENDPEWMKTKTQLVCPIVCVDSLC